MRGIVLLLTLFFMGTGAIKGSEELIRITIVYDNELCSESDGLIRDWGFSCLIKYNRKNILFDTGGNGKILLENMKLLNIDPRSVSAVFLSHAHGDHTGGLASFLRENHDVSVYIPKAFPDRIKKEITHLGANLLQIGRDPQQIGEGVYSTGELGEWIKEQSLILDTPRGSIVITGCAHPGIVKIAERAMKITGKKILLLIGGFHLCGIRKSEITHIALHLKKLGVINVAPTHCSGEKARLIFKEIFGKNYIPAGLGITIRGDKL